MRAAWIWSAVGLVMPRRASSALAEDSAPEMSAGSIGARGVNPAMLLELSGPGVRSVIELPLRSPLTIASAFARPPAHVAYCDAIWPLSAAGAGAAIALPAT